MTENPIQLAIIVGSTREGRFGPTVARWFAGRARTRDDLTIDLIDLADVELPAVYPQRPGPSVEAFVERLDRADAFVVVTPEYNHGYPASLKQAIDLAYDEWRQKPVGFVSYGGASGGLRAVEQLRQVFPEVHAVTVRSSVSFHMAHRLFDEAGDLHEPPATTWWPRRCSTSSSGGRRRCGQADAARDQRSPHEAGDHNLRRANASTTGRIVDIWAQSSPAVDRCHR